MPETMRGVLVIISSVYLLLGVWSCTVKVGLSASSAVCPNDTETLRNVVFGSFNGSEHVLVGSSEALYRISSSFEKEQGDFVFLDSPNQLLVVDQQGTYEGSVFHCGMLECSLSPLSDLSEHRWQVLSDGLTAGGGNIIGLFAPGPNGVSSLLLGEKESRQLPDRASRVAKGNLVNVDEGGAFSFNTLAIQEEVDVFRARDFLAVFSFQNFSYFIANLMYTDDNSVSVHQTRITRVCNDDIGNGEQPPIFTSNYELVLECPNPCSNHDDYRPLAATFVNSDHPFGTEVAIVSFGGNCSNDSFRNVLCTYSISEVNRLMDLKFETCLQGGMDDVGFARNGNTVPCPQLSSVQISQSVSFN